MNDAPRAEFFRGHTSDTVHDRAFHPGLAVMTEALFTQSNARVLIGQAANGTFRMIALPTQVYPAPTLEWELGLGPGMYHHFDVAMYAGDLTYRIAVDDGATIDLAAPERENATHYADHFIPLTHTTDGDFDITMLSFAPVAPDGEHAPLAPAPLPGPAGAFYGLRVRNNGTLPCAGKVVLVANDMLIGHYEDAEPAARSLNHPDVHLRQGTLILSRPEGSVGVHLHHGHWVNVTKEATQFEAEKRFSLGPGEEAIFETFISAGAQFADVMPEMYNWEDFAAGPNHFGVHWAEDPGVAVATICNDNAEPWTVQVGFRQPSAGAEGGLAWQSRTLAAGESATFTQAAGAPTDRPDLATAAIVRLEAEQFGENGIIFRRFGPTVLWGAWDGRQLWGPDAHLPLTLRFVVANATEAGWRDVCVKLNGPEGWEMQMRPANHWPQPDSFAPGVAKSDLSSVQSGTRAVASFYIKPPREYDLVLGYMPGGRAAHSPTQPGNEVTLYAQDVDTAVQTEFTAELHAVAADGQIIEKRLTVPFYILPRR